MTLPKSYYLQEDVVALSRNLLGKYLFTKRGEVVTGGMIIETEAYRGPHDRASHAHGNRRTPRNSVMYAEGGVAYVYLCYGIHYLFNIVTNCAEIPHAILIRAIRPTAGIELMAERRSKPISDPALAVGPGNLSQALAIDLSLNGAALTGDEIWLEEGIVVDDADIVAGPRIGVHYAGEDALLPWRFRLRN